MECNINLNKIIKGNLQYSVTYGNGLSNHLSMAVIALYHLIKEDTNLLPLLDTLNERTIPKLSIYKAKKPLLDFNQIEDARKIDLLGKIEYFDAWHVYFLKQIENNGEDAVLKQWLPLLIKGLSGAGGHCLLRIYFALLAKGELEKAVFNEELAFGLSYFASYFLPLGKFSKELPKLSKIKKSISFKITNDQVLLNKEAKYSLVNSHLIATKLKIISWDTTFQNLRTNISPLTNMFVILEFLAREAIKKVDFALLHNITVGQAILDLLEKYPYLHKTHIKQAYLDFVIGVYFLRRNSYEIPDTTSENELITLEEIEKEVPNLKNDHSIKSVFSLINLYKRSKKTIFLTAAKSFMQYYK